MIIFTWAPTTPLEYAAGLADVRQELQDMSVPLERSVTDVMSPSIEFNFISEGRPSWAPLAAFTIAKKGHDTILQESGDLEDQATSLSSWDIRTNTAVLDGIDDYGKHQNYGFHNVLFDTVVPSRQWAVFQPEDEDEIVDVFWDWLEEVFERSLP